MLTDDTRIRDFPALGEMTYLNTAAEGIPPLRVVTALQQYACDKLLGMDGRVLHEAQRRRAQAEVATLLGLSADEISFCSCSSEAFNLAALALRLKAGDEVVINDLDFPAGVTPWLQSTCPATVKVWRSRQGALRVEDLIEQLSSRTRLVTSSIVSFYNGYRIPLQEVVTTVRKHSPALIAVDVTQSLGRVTMDLSGVDLSVSSTHKWLLASHGGGIVGVPKSRVAEWTVPAGGWFNSDNAFDADRFERVVIKPGAASFGTGMPNYPAIYAIAAAAAYINEISVASIQAAANSLVHECLDELMRMPVDLLTPNNHDTLAGIVAFRHPRADKIHRSLLEQKIHVMSHAGRLRVALHGYNTRSDVERLLRAMHKILAHE